MLLRRVKQNDVLCLNNKLCYTLLYDLMNCLQPNEKLKLQSIRVELLHNYEGTTTIFDLSTLQYLHNLIKRLNKFNFRA